MPTESDQPEAGCSSPCDLSSVDGEETLMRRLQKRLAEYDRGQTPPLQAGAFLPTKRDDDGLSLNRRFSDQHPSFLTPIQLKNWHEVPEGIRETCGVVAILATRAVAIGLTIKPSPASTPGHVVIEELNWEDFAGSRETEESRTKIIGWAIKLAKEADVPITPGKPPKT